MYRILSASAALLVFGLMPVSSMATSTIQRPAVTAHPLVTLVAGWWEQEHREQDARERYWRLPPQQLGQYNRLQAEQNQRAAQRRKFNEEDNRARQEQHRLLGFDAQ
jgi:hypothetical protein